MKIEILTHDVSAPKQQIDIPDFAIHESGALALLDEEGKPKLVIANHAWISVRVVEK